MHRLRRLVETTGLDVAALFHTNGSTIQAMTASQFLPSCDQLRVLPSAILPLLPLLGDGCVRPRCQPWNGEWSLSFSNELEHLVSIGREHWTERRLGPRGRSTKSKQTRSVGRFPRKKHGPALVGPMAAYGRLLVETSLVCMYHPSHSEHLNPRLSALNGWSPISRTLEHRPSHRQPPTG